MAQKKDNRSFKEKYRVYFAAGITAWIIFMFIHPIAISGDAMSPTIKAGEIVIVSKENLEKKEPELFSVVDFHKDFSDQGEENTNKVRRIIGIPGDTIEIKNGLVYRNGESLDETYATGDNGQAMGPITLGEGEIFVLGDNREQSLDSRQVGPLLTKDLRGTCSWIVWPLSEWGKI